MHTRSLAACLPSAIGQAGAAEVEVLHAHSRRSFHDSHNMPVCPARDPSSASPMYAKFLGNALHSANPGIGCGPNFMEQACPRVLQACTFHWAEKVAQCKN